MPNNDHPIIDKADLPADYRLVPEREIQQRLVKLQQQMVDKEYGGCLFLQNTDIFYLSGTIQDGILLIPATGSPIFWVRRCLERARRESSLENIWPLRNLRQVTAYIDQTLPKKTPLGFELDVLPAKIFQKFQAQLPGYPLFDCSPLIRQLRSIKSPYEIDRIKRACQLADQVMAAVPKLLSTRISEQELEGELACLARRHGHLGLARMRKWNSEITFGHILSGPYSALRGYLDAPTNGLGLCPALPQGASRQPIIHGQPVSIDFMINFDGYLCDCTRMFCLGRPDKKTRQQHRNLLKLLRELESYLQPGITGNEPFERAIEIAVKMGYGPNYLGHGDNQAQFVGHGLGLEVDEFPFIARNNQDRLKTNMVFALEPKFIFPGQGVITIENTYLLTEHGCRSLTLFPEKILIVD